MHMFETKPTTSEALTIESVVRDYFEGYLKAESETLLKAFNKEARLFSVENGNLDKTEMFQWLENLRSRKEKGDIRQADVSIDGVDISGVAAVVKTTLRFAKFQFTDYLSLLYFDGGWKIVNKIYTTQNL